MLLAATEKVRNSGGEIPLVITARSEPNYLAKEDDFENLARRCDANFFCGSGIDSPDILTMIEEANCDIAISMNWPTVLSKKVLDLFPIGIFNAHPGNLPRYRGNACPNWAILQDEKEVVLCIHQMTEELDAGPIAFRDSFSIAEGQYVGDVYDWLRVRVPALFLELVGKAAEDNFLLEEQPSDPLLALRAFPRRPNDSQINWRQSSDAIWRLVRASSRPFDGAFTTLEGAEKIIVWRAEPFQSPTPFLAMPGQIVFFEGSDPVIACGDGMLRLEEVESLNWDSVETKKRIGSSMRNRMI